MSIEYNSRKIRDLIKSTENNPVELVIPNFQRDFVWERDSQKNLLASFLTSIPIGSLLLLKGNNGDFSAKSMCYKDPLLESDDIKQECIYLLDGQQRLSTIKGLINNPFKECDCEKKFYELYDKLYVKLRSRWFLRIEPNKDEEDIWGYKWLSFDYNNIFSKEPSDVLPFLSYKLDLKNANNHYSPLYAINHEEKNKNSEWLNAISHSFANEKLIPLWAIYGDSILIDSVIDKIADIARHNLSDRYHTSHDKLEFINELKLNNPSANQKDLSTDSQIKSVFADLRAEWKSAVKDYLTNRLQDQEVSTIELPKNEIGRATIIFENLNRGGTPLSTFDLIVAKSYEVNHKSLRDRLRDFLEEEESLNVSKWNASYIGAIEHKNEDLHNETKDQFLNILSLIHYFHKFRTIDSIIVDHVKKNSILSLTKDEVLEYYEAAAKSLKRAFAFLQLRCGIKEINNLTYKLMILPIAFIFQFDEKWSDKKIWDKIEYWYWLSLFSGRYRENQNQRSINDVKDIYKWIMKDDEEVDNRINMVSDRFKNILDDEGYSDLSTLLLEGEEKSVPKGIINGILQYEVSNKPSDLFVLTINYNQAEEHEKQLADRKIFNVNLNVSENITNNYEIHHIIPVSSSTNMGESSKSIRKDKTHILNSPLNLTCISKDANSKVKDYQPSEYLKNISQNINELALSKHHIPSDSKLLYNIEKSPTVDNYKEFCKQRYHELKRGIQNELEVLYNS